MKRLQIKPEGFFEALLNGRLVLHYSLFKSSKPNF
jgi:hypothetical protein